MQLGFLRAQEEIFFFYKLHLTSLCVKIANFSLQFQFISQGTMRIMSFTIKHDARCFNVHKVT